MIYFKWLIFAILNTLINIIAVILSPVISTWSMITNNTKPSIFKWFYTHDRNLDGWKIQWPELANETNLSTIWWNRVCWICRNPGYGFAAYVIGLKIIDVNVTETVVGNVTRHVFTSVNGKPVGFGYRTSTEKWHIWLGWACPSHDGVHYMLKLKVKPR